MYYHITNCQVARICNGQILISCFEPSRFWIEEHEFGTTTLLPSQLRLLISFIRDSCNHSWWVKAQKRTLPHFLVSGKGKTSLFATSWSDSIKQNPSQWMLLRHCPRSTCQQHPPYSLEMVYRKTQVGELLQRINKYIGKKEYEMTLKIRILQKDKGISWAESKGEKWSSLELHGNC